MAVGTNRRIDCRDGSRCGRLRLLRRRSRTPELAKRHPAPFHLGQNELSSPKRGIGYHTGAFVAMATGLFESCALGRVPEIVGTSKNLFLDGTAGDRAIGDEELAVQRDSGPVDGLHALGIVVEPVARPAEEVADRHGCADVAPTAPVAKLADSRAEAARRSKDFIVANSQSVLDRCQRALPAGVVVSLVGCSELRGYLCDGERQ